MSRILIVIQIRWFSRIQEDAKKRGSWQLDGEGNIMGERRGLGTSCRLMCSKGAGCEGTGGVRSCTVRSVATVPEYLLPPSQGQKNGSYGLRHISEDNIHLHDNAKYCRKLWSRKPSLGRYGSLADSGHGVSL
jgi:hypothetical protein